MQGSERQRKAASTTSRVLSGPDRKSNGLYHAAQFTAARDSRNRRVPGLYIRNGRFYAQLWVDLGNGGKGPRRFALVDQNNEPIRTLAAAKEALEVKRHQRREHRLPRTGVKPSFIKYTQTYLGKATVQRKRPGTVENEKQALARWTGHLGHLRIDRIAPPIVNVYMEKRLKGGLFGRRELAPCSERTVNLDLVVLRNVLNAAVDDGHLLELPRIKMLDEPPPPKRRLLTPDEFGRLLTAARDGSLTNGPQLADYLSFLAFSGAREQEALRIKWSDVDLENERVVIGADGLSKNWESRTVEFNPKLRRLLRDMYKHRPPDSVWLFPSPRRGFRDEHARSFRESLKIARKAAGLEWLGFHDLRHYFCSVCVMAGIDFMTIAAWLGHKDGGILVGKVYGHLLDEHRRKAAKLVRFGVAA